MCLCVIKPRITAISDFYNLLFKTTLAWGFRPHMLKIKHTDGGRGGDEDV